MNLPAASFFMTHIKKNIKNADFFGLRISTHRTVSSKIRKPGTYVSNLTVLADTWAMSSHLLDTRDGVWRCPRWPQDPSRWRRWSSWSSKWWRLFWWEMKADASFAIQSNATFLWQNWQPVAGSVAWQHLLFKIKTSENLQKGRTKSRKASKAR